MHRNKPNITYLLNLIEIWSLRSNWQYIIIGSGNGLAPNRPQAIIWTSDGLVNWHIQASLGLNELSIGH